MRTFEKQRYLYFRVRYIMKSDLPPKPVSFSSVLPIQKKLLILWKRISSIYFPVYCTLNVSYFSLIVISTYVSNLNDVSVQFSCFSVTWNAFHLNENLRVSHICQPFSLWSLLTAVPCIQTEIVYNNSQKFKNKYTNNTLSNGKRYKF